MNENLYPKELISNLKEILKKDTNNAEIIYQQSYQNVYLKTDDINVKLMLRFIKPHKKIIIARIDLQQKRKGHLTAILNCLKKIEGYEVIEFECVLTDEMLQFCKKNEFEQVPNVPFNYAKRFK